MPAPVPFFAIATVAKSVFDWLRQREERAKAEAELQRAEVEREAEAARRRWRWPSRFWSRLRR